MQTKKIQSILDQINDAATVDLDGQTIDTIEISERRGSPGDVALELIYEEDQCEFRTSFTEWALDRAELEDANLIVIQDFEGEKRTIALFDIVPGIVIKNW